MNKFGLSLAIILATLFAPIAQANGPWKREFQDIKLPSQAILDHYTWVNPALGSGQTILNAGTAATSAATTFSTFAAQPDFPRNVVITPGGTTANVGAGTAVVTGTNIYGKTITENFTIASTQSTATTGAKAFKSITSILFPATTGASVTVTVVAGNKLGIPRCTDAAGDYSWSMFNLAFETTRGTFAANATLVESNTFTPNGTMDGSKNVDLFYVQNFRCYPN